MPGAAPSVRDDLGLEPVGVLDPAGVVIRSARVRVALGVEGRPAVAGRVAEEGVDIGARTAAEGEMVQSGGAPVVRW